MRQQISKESVTGCWHDDGTQRESLEPQMETFMTSAEKTLAVPRADSTDSARTPAGIKGADPNGTPFDMIFHAASSRSGAAETSGPAGFRTAESTDAPDGDLHTRLQGDREDDPGASADTPTATPGPATRPEVTRHAKADADNTATRSLTDEDMSAAQTVAGDDPMIDQTDTHMRAMTMFERAEATRIDAADPSHSGPAVAHRFESLGAVAFTETGGTSVSKGPITPDRTFLTGPAVPGRMPDRLPPDIEAQSLVASAAIKSDRAHGAALIDPLNLALVIEGRRTERGTDPAGWRIPMARGQGGAGLSSPTGAPPLANTASSAVMQGRKAEALPSASGVSAVFADSASTDGADRRRDLDMPPGADPRGTSTGNSGPATLATLPRSDLPQTIAMQIAAAIQKGGPGMKPGIELRLSPDELGAVRLTFVQSETGVTVNVHAERAETLELLRRNIDSLAQEFLDIGYQSAEFTFDRRDTEAQSASHSVATADPEAPTERAPDASRAINPTLLISERLDIRL
ncbi:MAG: flagellar hook-length control protein FliK [Pseudomonadota bacterium]